MIRSFGGTANSRFSKKSDYLLVGLDAKAGKFGDAKEKGLGILSLRQLQGVLLGHISFADLKKQPTLSSDQFAGHNYQVFAFVIYGLRSRRTIPHISLLPKARRGRPSRSQSSHVVRFRRNSGRDSGEKARHEEGTEEATKEATKEGS